MVPSQTVITPSGYKPTSQETEAAEPIVQETSRPLGGHSNEENSQNKDSLVARPSPFEVFQTFAQKGLNKKINRVEDMEKFLMALIQFQLDSHQEDMEYHRMHLGKSQEKWAALRQKLSDLNIQVESNGSVSFWTGAQTGMSIATAALAVAAPFLGIPALLGASVLFIAAWVTAIRNFFSYKKDEQKAGVVIVRESQDICANEIRDRSKVITKSLQAWSRDAERMVKIIKTFSDLKNKSMRNIKNK